jgi:UDP-2-acetamido-2-deoxy-ribo-hexuluronate aminotransferase
MLIPFTDLKTQYKAIKTQVQSRINSVLDHGQFIMGPEVQELEDKLATYTGAKHCITVSSGTEAILISLMSLNIKPGDEIITTSFTFIATIEMIVLLGAKPIFVDIEKDTCNINTELIEEKINAKTMAIMPVSMYGQPANMKKINEIAKLYGNIPVIEDAAQSFGAVYREQKSCNLSTIGCTSFFPSKPLGCYGDGGAIFTQDDTLAKIMREIRVHGQSQRYVHTRLGVGGRMDTIQCAIVLAKLDRFEWELSQRIAKGKYYNKIFDDFGIQRVKQINYSVSVFAQYTIFTEKRQELQERLAIQGIPTAIHYPVPLNEQPAYKHLCCDNCTPLAKENSNMVLSLPISADMTVDDQNKIIKQVIKISKDLKLNK